MNYEPEYKKIQSEYDSIVALDSKKKGEAARARGFSFEKLMHKMFDDAGLLIESSYKTAITAQQIDGAITICSRICLLEIKWERSETLAASKLYSFLGKINSKMEGTIGLFVSYNTLSESFINAARSGLKQNCMIIHGKDNIENLIAKKVDLKTFLEFLYKQVSIKGLTTIDTSEFINIPVPVPVSSSSTNSWATIANMLIDPKVNKSALVISLQSIGNKEISIIEKAIDVFPVISYDAQTIEKYNEVLHKCYDIGKALLIRTIQNKFLNNRWEKYSNEVFIKCISEEIQLKSTEFEKDKVVIIVDKLLKHLGEKEGEYEEENNVSRVLQYFLEHIDSKKKFEIAIAYFNIYCDSIHRKSKFEQKSFSNKIYDLVKNDKTFITQHLMPLMREKLKEAKDDAFIFEDKDDNETKERAISMVVQRFAYKFKAITSQMLADEYDKITA